MKLLRFFKKNDLRLGDIRLSSSSLLTANQIKSSKMPFLEEEENRCTPVYIPLAQSKLNSLLALSNGIGSIEKQYLLFRLVYAAMSGWSLS